MGALRLMIQPKGEAASSVGFEQPLVKLGRGSQCEIRLPFQIVSSHHLTFLREKDDYRVVDVGSTNGTYLNGVRLEPNVPTLIRSGHQLRIVDLTIGIEVEKLLSEGFTLAESTIMLRQMMSAALRPTDEEDGETAFLEFVDGLGTGRRVVLPDDLENGWIGSAADSLVHVNHPAIAARVGEIKRNGDGYGIEPMDANGELIRVNGVVCRVFQSLRNRDRVSVGGVELVFHDPLEEHLAALDGQRPVGAEVDVRQEPAAAGESVLGVAPENDAVVNEVIQDVSVSVSEASGAETLSLEAEKSDKVEKGDKKTKAPKREPLGMVELGLIALSGVLMLAGLVLFLYILEIF